MAIIVLAQDSSYRRSERYDIYRDSDEVGKMFEQVGFGMSGTGQTGEDNAFAVGVRSGRARTSTRP